MNLGQLMFSTGQYEHGLARIIDPEGETEDFGVKSGIEIDYKNVRPVIDIFFENERNAYPRIDQNLGGIYLILKTDSSSRVISHKAFGRYIKPALDKTNYSSEDKCTIETGLADIFANAVIFGSESGDEDDYLRRKKNPPTPDEREKNKGKPICLELLITNAYALVRVTDTGKGMTDEDYAAAKQYAEVPDNYKLLSEDEQRKYIKPYGRGLFMIEKTTGEKPLFRKEYAFSTSFLVHKDTGVGACQYPPRDKNRTSN